MPPVGKTRSDYDILTGVAARMGLREAFTEGRTSEDWIEHIYHRSRQAAAEAGIDIPTLSELKSSGWYELDKPKEPNVLFADFRADPDRHPLNTPSGRIEIWSETIEAFAYDDCPPHPAWMEPAEWLGNATRYPLHMISNQPRDKLHSQLDHGAISRTGKIDGREPVVMHPDDARRRGIRDGDVVRVFNERGSCYCGARISDDIRPGVIQISTGAWFDPETPGTLTACKHGNPNMLTLDKGGSKLSQGPIAHSCLVEAERALNPPPVTAFKPPAIIRRTS